MKSTSRSRFQFIPFLITVVALATFAVASPVDAQVLTITNLTQLPLPVPADGEAIYSGTLTDIGNTAISLDSLTFNFPTPGNGFLTGDSSLFDDLAFPAASLDAGQSYTGDLFGVLSASNTPQGVYSGSISISDSGATYRTTQPFTVNVSSSSSAPVPESSTIVLLSIGIIGLIGLSCKSRFRRRI